MEQLLTIEQVAEKLSVSHWTVRYFIQSGQLHRVKLGRRVLVEPSELERFVESCKGK